MSFNSGNIVYGVKLLEHIKNTGGLTCESFSKESVKTAEEKIYEEAEKERQELDKYKKYLDSLNN